MLVYEMICEDYKSLVHSVIYTGSQLQGHDSASVIRLHPWYDYLYLAKYVREKNEPVRHKIGITNRDIQKRDDELSRRTTGTTVQDPSRIVYVWASPINDRIEAMVKNILRRFTDKDSTKSGATETFNGISFRNMLWIVRLVTLYVFTNNEGYLKLNDQARKAHRVLDKYFRVRIDVVRVCNGDNADEAISGVEWRQHDREKGIFYEDDVLLVQVPKSNAVREVFYWVVVVTGLVEGGSINVRYLEEDEEIDGREFTDKWVKDWMKDEGIHKGKINKLEWVQEDDVKTDRIEPTDYAFEHAYLLKESKKRHEEDFAEEVDVNDISDLRILQIDQVFCELSTATNIPTSTYMNIRGLYSEPKEEKIKVESQVESQVESAINLQKQENIKAESAMASAMASTMAQLKM